ncbi:MAG: LysR family transcriptional regulator, partial [Nitrospinae bacterium]|nr:LysR family transcriptional regulator [Nitrospinota bacterium]
DTKQFNSRLLASSPISVFAGSKFKHLKRNFPKSLRKQNFIFPTLHSKLRHDLDHFFLVNEISVKLIIETQDTAVQKMLGIEGLGLVPLPDFAAKKIVQNGELVKLGTLPELKEDFWLVSSPRRIQNPVSFSLFETFQLKF